jgi:hypothetical protein
MNKTHFYSMGTYLVLLFLIPVTLLGQPNFPWPVEPLFQNHYISGTFCEYRSTSASGHFHNGTDIPKADGSPVYTVRDGILTALSSTGSNAYVRVQDKAYVHIMPNPALSIGDSVFASQTILGTILPGQGHIHFTNGYVGSEVSSMLTTNSFTPLADNWAPIIRYVNFYQNNTPNQFPTNELSGLVDIMVKVDEQNAPQGSSTAYLNNGTYKIGYKILSGDSSTVVFEPPNGGLRFQFNSKPNNNYVNIVYFRTLSSTTSHVYQVTNDIGIDNYWDTRGLPEDDYVVLVFTEDTRQNTDTAYVTVRVVPSDTTAPAQPVLKYVKGTDNDMRVGWYPNSDPDLLGYRLYFSFDNVNWALFKDETALTASVTDTIINSVLNNAIYFRLTAVDNAPLPNESIYTDFYGMSNGAAFLKRVLIVDGFDRTNGGWPVPYHYFSFTHGQSIKVNQYSFDTVPNDAVEDGSVNLNDYEAIFWILGDESIQDETFNSAEQTLVKNYLENGGFLFVSGSDIARDLHSAGNPAATPQDEVFLHDYLKITFENRSAVANSLSGLSGSLFDGMNFSYGFGPYVLDSIDVISPWGSMVSPALQYGTNQLAAIQYAGAFGSGTVGGKIVLCSFPFETLSDEQSRNEFMEQVLQFFFPATGIDTDQTQFIPQKYTLNPNYPNPFNPQTTISYQLPHLSKVDLQIYNTLGQKVRNLVAKQQPPGVYQVIWDGRNDNSEQLASGIYIATFSARAVNSDVHFRQTNKLLFTK